MNVSVHRPRTGKDIGIFEKSVVIQMLADGKLEPDDVAFGDGFKSWVPIHKLQPKSPSLMLQASLSKANALAHQANPTTQIASPASPLVTVWRCLTFLPRLIWKWSDAYRWLLGWTGLNAYEAWVSKTIGLVFTIFFATLTLFATCEPVLVFFFPEFSSKIPKVAQSSPAANTPIPREHTLPTVEVVNSSWDGSVKQVKRWLETNENDPDSIKYISWGPVHNKQGDKYYEARKEAGYWVQCNYRAKNAFGALVIKRKEFHLGASGEVTKVLDF